MHDNPQTLIPRVMRLIAEQLHIEVPQAETDLLDEGLLDSLMLVELVVQIEKQFELTLPVAELDVEDFRTAKRIAAYIGRCRELADADAA